MRQKIEDMLKVKAIKKNSLGIQRMETVMTKERERIIKETAFKMNIKPRKQIKWRERLTVGLRNYQEFKSRARVYLG